MEYMCFIEEFLLFLFSVTLDVDLMIFQMQMSLYEFIIHIVLQTFYY